MEVIIEPTLMVDQVTGSPSITRYTSTPEDEGQV